MSSSPSSPNTHHHQIRERGPNQQAAGTQLPRMVIPRAWVQESGLGDPKSSLHKVYLVFPSLQRMNFHAVLWKAAQTAGLYPLLTIPKAAPTAFLGPLGHLRSGERAQTAPTLRHRNPEGDSPWSTPGRQCWSLNRSFLELEAAGRYRQVPPADCRVSEP